MNFNTGIPDFESVIIAEGYGRCHLKHFYENGDVLLYMGGNRLFTVPGSTRWKYAGF